MMSEPLAPQVAQRFEAATACVDQGRFDEAVRLYLQVLELAPNYPPALRMLGVLALRRGQYQAAIDMLAAAVAAEPNDAGFRNDFGEALRLSGQLDAAAEAFQTVLVNAPDHAGATNNLGIVRHAQGQFQAAHELYRRAVSLDPNSVSALTNLGVLLMSLGTMAEARTILERARHLAPRAAPVALNLGNLYLQTDDLAAAEALYREAIALDPGSAAAQVNLGRSLKEQGRIAEALSACIKAKSIDPNLPAAHWNEGICRLLLGDLARGWQGFYWRWRADAVPPHNLTLPEWDGGSLAGRHLLVHAEQGLGDTLQFIRFLPRLIERIPASVTLLCQPALLGLLGRFPGADRVIGPDEDMGDCDIRIPLLDLPLRLGLGLAALSAGGPYLTADPLLTDAWRGCFGPAPGKRIGLVWKGRAQHANDRNRSIPLQALMPLFRLDGVAWFSLQKETSAEERAILAASGVVDLSGDLADMTDTAAAVSALDMVVSVDTSVAHLAGALGRPVWILLPMVPDWRWLLTRVDTPWYPSATLFRQPVRGDWGSVVAALISALAGDR